MKVLVLGYGSMGKRHAANAQVLGHEVKVYDPAVAESGQFELFRDEREAFNSRPGAVVIASPAVQHAYHFWAATAATDGPIFVEKPLAISIKDFWSETPKNEQTYTRIRNRVHVGYMLRYHTGIQRLRELIDGQQFLGARICVSTDATGWKGTAYADALLECSHELDLALHLLGPAKETTAQQAIGGALWQAQTHCGGVPTQFHLDTLRRGYARYIELFTGSNFYRWSWQPKQGGWWEGQTTRHTPAVTETQFSKQTPDDLYRTELEAFFAGDDTHACSLGEALDVLRLVDAARAYDSNSLHP